jgi:hypothetical protein
MTNIFSPVQQNIFLTFTAEHLSYLYSICEAALADEEFGAAAAVDPYAAAVGAPGAALDAGRAADLPFEADVATIADVAPVSAVIVRGADDDLRRWRRWRARTAADDELGAAALVDPEAALVDTPGASADAGRTADLADELGIAGAADVAPVSASVIGGAGDARTAVAWLRGGW